jgi:hypothetical protein
MNKKIFITILFSILLLTGCTARYDVKIQDNKVKENISITMPSTYSDAEIKKAINYYNSKNKYEVEIKRDTSQTQVILTGKSVKLGDFFSDSDSFPNKCYNRVSFLSENGNYYIGTSKGFSCLTYEYMELNSISINIKTYHEVYDTNADKVKNNVYTWNIDRNNLSTNSIKFIFSKTKYVWYYRYRYLFGGLGAVSIILTLGYIIYKIFSSFSNRANRF